MSSWDDPGGTLQFEPCWGSLEKGPTVSVVMDGLLLSNDMMMGTTVPGLHRIKVFGAINQQVQGCRRLTMFDAVYDTGKDCIELLLTDKSVVIAHGLRPTTDMFRVVGDVLGHCLFQCAGSVMCAVLSGVLRWLSCTVPAIPGSLLFLETFLTRLSSKRLLNELNPRSP